MGEDYTQPVPKSSPGGRFAKWPAWLTKHLIQFPHVSTVILLVAAQNRNWFERDGRRIGDWHVHQGKLAIDLGISPRAVARAIRFLVDVGLLEQARRGVFHVDIEHDLDLVKLKDGLDRFKSDAAKRGKFTPDVGVKNLPDVGVKNTPDVGVNSAAIKDQVEASIDGVVEAPRGAAQGILPDDPGVTWSKMLKKVEFTTQGKRRLYDHLKALAEKEKLSVMLTKEEFHLVLGRLSGHFIAHRYKTGPATFVPIVYNWFENDLRAKAQRGRGQTTQSRNQEFNDRVWEQVKRDERVGVPKTVGRAHRALPRPKDENR